MQFICLRFENDSNNQFATGTLRIMISMVARNISLVLLLLASNCLEKAEGEYRDETGGMLGRIFKICSCRL